MSAKRVREVPVVGRLEFAAGMAEEADEDSLDNELVGGKEVGVGFVFCLQIGASVAEEVTLEGRLAVYQGCDDVALAGLAKF